MASPLDNEKSQTSGTSDFRVREIPKLSKLVKESGFSIGLERFDSEFETWRQNLERDINTRTQGTQGIDLSQG
jgi:hypothetical protein